jgi:hypothetical protein
MGYYIDPPGETKEAWLAQHGTPLRSVPQDVSLFDEDGNEALPVCLVDNGIFTAAGIVYSNGELQAFTDPFDARPKYWYAVSKDKLIEVQPVLADVLV